MEEFMNSLFIRTIGKMIKAIFCLSSYRCLRSHTKYINLMQFTYIYRFLIIASVLFWSFAFSNPVKAQTNNPIAVENQQIGTTSWNITQSADDLAKQIKGYGSASSINVGDRINFYVSVAPAQLYQIEIYRMGYYAGKGGRLMMTVGPLSGSPQAFPGPAPLTGLIEYDWAVGYSLSVPNNWTSGVYMAKLINAAGFENYIPFVVRDDNRTADLLYQQAVTMDLAYNNFPNVRTPDLTDSSQIGKSTYNYNSYGANTIAGNTRAVKVSFDRPNPDDGSGLFFEWEYHQIRWLERMGYDVSYSSNIDTHENGINLLNYRGFISPGHDEYWSAKMFDAAETARDSGVNLAFFGSNAVYWQVRFEPSSNGVRNRIMVSYKDYLLDPETNASLETVRFRHAGRAEQQLIGIQYVTYNGSPSNNTEFIPQNLAHWTYNNTGFIEGDTVSGIVGYEVDLYDPNYPLPVNQNYTLLSASPFVSQYRNTVTAHSSIYQAPSNAWVFGSGTMSWSWALDKSEYIDPRIQQMTTNVLDRFISGEPPIVTAPINQSSLEQETVLLDIIATDSTLDTLTYSAEGLPPGLSINSSTGKISGNINDGSAASYNVTVKVSDGVHVVNVSFIWTILSVNQSPTIVAPNAQVNIELDTVSLTIDAADEDDEAISYSASNLPDGLAINATTGKITGTIASGAVGVYTAVVTATDDIANAVTSFSWTVNALVNEEPLLTVPADRTNSEGDLISLAIAATDPNGDSLTYGATGLPERLTINSATGLISGALSMASSGSYNITIYVTDTVQSVSDTFVWDVNNVNQLPSIANPNAQINNEGDAISLQINANDPDGDSLSVSATGLPTGLSIDRFSGTIIGTLGPTSAGTYNVLIEVSDDSDISSTSFIWMVNALNEAPTIDEIELQVSASGTTIALQTVAADRDNDPLTYTATDLPPGLSINERTGLISGVIPLNAVDISYNVSIIVDDGRLIATTTFVWSVSNANDAPVITPPSNQTTTSTEGETISLTIVAVDSNNTPLTFSATGLPNGLAINSTSGTIAGTLSFESSGVYTATVEVTDGQLSDTATFLWTVIEINQPPNLANPNAKTSNETDVVLLTISADDADGDRLLYSATGLPTGLVINASTGLISGTIDALAAGEYDVTVAVDDGINVTAQIFTWTVNSTNQPPLLLNPINRVRTVGDVVSIPISADDPDNDPLTFTATGLPPGLSMNPLTGEIYGSVAPASAGTYTVNVVVSDGALTNTDSFVWTIIGEPVTNRPPGIITITDQSSSEGTGVSLQIDATDADNDVLTYSASGLPIGLTINTNTGLISGLLTIGTSGTYPTTILVTDGSDSVTTSFVWIVTTPVTENTCGNLIQEAEEGTLSEGIGGFVIGADSSASGGRYIHAPEGSGSVWDGPDTTRKVDYCFTITEAGVYRIKANVFGEDTLSNSFYLRVDGAPANGYLWDTVQNVSYDVDFASDRNAADPTELALAIGEHVVSIYVREDGTRLDTIALERSYAVPPTEPTCSGLVQEAEAGVLTGDFTIMSDAAANGGAYIYVPETSGDVWNGADETQKATYCFVTTQPGTYRIQGDVLGADPLSDSFYLKVNGAPSDGHLWDVTPSTNYVADFVNDRGIANPVELSLDAGNHIVTLYLREDATRLDRISLIPINIGPPPTPVCAGLLQEAENGLLSGNFEVAADSDASGGKYIHAPEGSGHFWNGPVPAHAVEYCFVVPNSGNYVIQGRVHGADTLSDSFYMKLNSSPSSGYLWDVEPNSIYATDLVRDRNNPGPISVALSAGNNYVTLFVREDGTRLDTIELVSLIAAANNQQEGTDAERKYGKIAQGISGFVSAEDLHLSDEMDFSQIYVTVVDTETNGQRYREQTIPDRIGRYRFDGMAVGDYILSIKLPDEYATTTPSVRIYTSTDSLNEISFDIVQLLDDPQGLNKESLYLPMIMLK